MLDQKDFNVIELEGTSYGIYNFKGENKEKVDIVSKLFEDGEINVLVGTQALLGEGWDSPCINSLILASYVGSFMLSNQMRGRAIRIDKNNHSKTANIWHLVTIEPEYVFEQNMFHLSKNLSASKKKKRFPRTFPKNLHILYWTNHYYDEGSAFPVLLLTKSHLYTELSLYIQSIYHSEISSF